MVNVKGVKLSSHSLGFVSSSSSMLCRRIVMLLVLLLWLLTHLTLVAVALPVVAAAADVGPLAQGQVVADVDVVLVLLHLGQVARLALGRLSIGVGSLLLLFLRTYTKTTLIEIHISNMTNIIITLTHITSRQLYV